MSRNLKRDYLKKLAGIETKNGFKIDLANYVYNPSFDYEYPTLKKLVEETPEKLTFVEYQYFKHYDGTGEYYKNTYTAPNNNDTWNITRDHKHELLEHSNRFSLNRLIALCEA